MYSGHNLVGFAQYWLFVLGNKQSQHITTNGFINQLFLEKLSYQNLLWGGARLYSLVNKRVAAQSALYCRWSWDLTQPPPDGALDCFKMHYEAST